MSAEGDADRELLGPATREYIRQLVADAPPPTEQQIATLRTLFAPYLRTAQSRRRTAA
jgi:hypothetical protein